jgi:hypothetical protein
MMRQQQSWELIDFTNYVTNSAFNSDTITRRGIPETMCLDRLVFDCRVDLTIGAPAQLFIGDTLGDLLDAFIGSVQWQSGPLGEIIQQQSLGQLFFAGLPVGARIEGNLPATTFQSVGPLAAISLNFRVSIPWSLPIRSVGSLFAPQAYQFPDGLLRCRFGASNTYTDGFGQVWTIAGTSQVRVQWQGSDHKVKVKASPLNYLNQLFSQRQQQPEGGLIMSMAQLTDTIDALGVPPVSAAGLILRADGVSIYDNTEYDPVFALSRAKESLPREASGYQSFGCGAATGDNLGAQAFVPLVFYREGTRLNNLISAQNELFLQMGNNYAATYTLSTVRVRRRDEIGDVKGCACPTGQPSIIMAQEPVDPRIDQYLPAPVA